LRKIVLVGNTIAAEILYSYLRSDKRYDVVATTVDDPYIAQGQPGELKCVGLSSVREMYPPDSHGVVMAVGYNDLNRTRATLFHHVKSLGYRVETYVHPDARIYSEHPLGEGCIVLPGAVIEPRAKVGDNSLVWCNVTLAHHSRVAENCWIAAGAVVAGQAVIERNTFVGVNATVVNEVIVAEFNIIGAGAMISKNTKPNSVLLARSAELFRYGSDDYAKFFWGKT